MPYVRHTNADGTPNLNWHILDSNFADQNSGLAVPARILVSAEELACSASREVGDVGHNTFSFADFGLSIENLDQADPPGYRAGGVPRDAAFNANVFNISADPRMPAITAKCVTTGFDPAEFPINWRLQCRHVFCRHQNRGSYQYRGAAEIMHAEWHGRSLDAEFTLFDTQSSTSILYDYNSNNPNDPLVGGHGILTVTAWPLGSSLLQDYVHLRIGGANPTRDTVLQYVDSLLAGRDANIINMVKAIFRHENNFNQFQSTAQQSASMLFNNPRRHFNDAGQPDCRVRFDWPDDPPNYPSIAFDFGVGISQYTKTPGIIVPAPVAWDWRENLKIGINEFMGKLRRTQIANQTWRDWALHAWTRYNGGDGVSAYANSLVANEFGQLVTNDVAPAGVNIAAVPAAPVPGPFPVWPPPQERFFAPTDTGTTL